MGGGRPPILLRIGTPALAPFRASAYFSEGVLLAEPRRGARLGLGEQEAVDGRLWSG